MCLILGLVNMLILTNGTIVVVMFKIMHKVLSFLIFRHDGPLLLLLLSVWLLSGLVVTVRVVIDIIANVSNNIYGVVLSVISRITANLDHVSDA